MAKNGLLRRWSGIVLVAMLALTVLAPTIDTFVCIDDVSGAVSVARSQAPSASSKDLPVQQHDDGDNSCIHGHCHHWVGYPRMAVRLAVAAATGRSGPIASRFSQPASAPPIELLRPPQA